jgi:carboxyl-terminal processing protease
MTSKQYIYTAFATLIVGLFLSGFSYRNDNFFQIKKNFTIFSEVFQEVTNRYVDEVDPEKLMRHGISSMLELLDPYTILIDEADNQTFEILTTGRYAGVGIEVDARAGRLVIIAPIEGYSAHQKGVRAGDIILEVDGISVANLALEDLQSLISGEPGTLLVLTVERYGFDQPIEFELIRENVEVKNIRFADFIDADKKIGYVSLSRFGQNAALELRAAIVKMQEDGNLESLILDLRNNPGGLLDEAVKTVDKFVGPGIEVVRTQGRSFESSFSSRTVEPQLFHGKLIILQNKGSASSSEIVAGALQDLDRAVVIGTRSFGKGLVQIISPLSYNTALKITTSRYYIPSGRSIQSAIYSHEEAGLTTQLPDSLRNAFKTRAGRVVYDGVGIDPDLEIKDRSQTLAEIALLQNSAYFFFANEYRSTNPEFNHGFVSDDIMNEFIEFLDRTSFDYTTRSERYLTLLEEQFKVDGIENSEKILANLKVVVENQKKQELLGVSDAIKKELYLELVARYAGQAGRFSASVKTDEVIRKATEIISDSNLYSGILRPTL